VLGLLRELGLPVELVSANVELDPVVAQHLLLAPHPHAAQLKLHDKFILEDIKFRANAIFRVLLSSSGFCLINFYVSLPL
jgi:hypothetical protein